jgi:nucleoside diphosphate kinase
MSAVRLATRFASTSARQQGRVAASLMHTRAAPASSPIGAAALALAAAGALAAASAYSRDSPVEMSYGPVAGISDIKALEKKIADLEADVAYPGRTTNSAFVFVKPAAVTPATLALVEKKFKSFGITVTGSGSLDAKTIDQEQLIDNHYGAIASKAVKLKPSELNVSAKAQAEFKQAFGMEWSEALAKGLVYNAVDGCKKMGCAPTDLEKKYWAKLEKGKTLLKFGGGFYCGQLAPDVFVINGFYMSMRSVFTTPPATLTWFTVEWPASSLSWEAFRGKVLGATDPKAAAPGSIRRAILDQWKQLKLKEEPNVGDNGVHASASPFEALAERMNWLGAAPETDPFGAACLAAGVDAATLAAWTQDPTVPFEGKPQGVFDLLEDTNAKACLEKMVAIKGAN